MACRVLREDSSWSQTLERVHELTKTLAECARSSQCVGFKHHFDECVERVTSASEDADSQGPKEDCVEECKSSLQRPKERIADSCFVQFSIYSTAPLNVPHPSCSSSSSKRRGRYGPTPRLRSVVVAPAMKRQRLPEWQNGNAKREQPPNVGRTSSRFYHRVEQPMPAQK